MRPASFVGKTLVEQIFSKQKLLVHLGGKLNRIEHGLVEISLPKTDLALQHHGFIHGGVVTTLADIAAGLSGASVLSNPDYTTITVELKINFIKPADTDVIGIGKVIK